MIAADAPLNSFPCLHAAFSVVAAFALLHGPLRSARWWQISLWILVAMICLAAIALRQHTDFDVLAGVALGGAAAWGYRRSLHPAWEPQEPGVDLAAVAELSTRD